MRISDWSSDVCSSDLFVDPGCRPVAYADRTTSADKGRALLPPDVLGKLLEKVGLSGGWKALVIGGTTGYSAAVLAAMGLDVTMLESDADLASPARGLQIGRASCRGRGGQYV